MKTLRILQISVLFGFLFAGTESGCTRCSGDCKSQKIDLTFVVDGSGSICQNEPDWNCPNWKAILKFIGDMVEYLNIGSNQDRVALVQFGNIGTKEIGLNQYTSKTELIQAIIDLRIKSENTNTSGGIKVMRTEVFSTDEDRSEVDNVAIVITDGKSTRDPSKTIPEARRAEAAKIRTYVVGVTPSIDRDEIRDISSSPRWENVTYWILPDFTVFDSFRVIQQVFNTFCHETTSFTTTPSNAPSCPGTRTTNGCYVFRESFQDWSSAEYECVALGKTLGYPGYGHLASLPDQSSYDTVLKMIKTAVASKTNLNDEALLDRVWVGGYEENVKFGGNKYAVWRWLDGLREVENQGCFFDNPANPEFTSTMINPKLTPSNCTAHCLSSSFKYAALQASNKCSCGNTYGIYGATSACSNFCGGDPTFYCGGTNKNNVLLLGGAFVKWGFDQPNNFNEYQPCGHLSLSQLPSKDIWEMGDTVCYEEMTYLCDVPKSFCISPQVNYHTVNTRCVYAENLQAVSWFKAREACKAKFGDLLTIDSAATFTALNDLLINTIRARAPYWIGLVGRLWKWQDGQDFIFTSWLSSEPNSIKDSCMIIESNPQRKYGWNEYDCSKTLPYVCYIASTVETTGNETETTEDVTRGPTTPMFSTSDSPATVSDPNIGASTADNKGLSIWTIMIIVACCLFLVVLLILIIICCWCKKHEKDRSNVYPEGKSHDNFYRPFYGESDTPATSTTGLDSELPRTSGLRVVTNEYEVPISNREATVATIRKDSIYSYDQLYNSVITTSVKGAPPKAEASNEEIKEKIKSHKSKKDRKDKERRERERRERSEERRRRREEKKESKKLRERKVKPDDSKHETIHYITSTVRSSHTAVPTNFSGESMTIDASNA